MTDNATGVTPAPAEQRTVATDRTARPTEPIDSSSSSVRTPAGGGATTPIRPVRLHWGAPVPAEGPDWVAR